MVKKEQKKNKEARIKQPRTIKVSTAVIALAFAVSVAAAFITGWHSHQAHDQYIEARVNSAVAELKTNEQ